MAIVAGVDFGTLSIRVTIVDTDRGRLGSGVAEFPLQRKKDDPDYATQSHTDHMRALAEAMRKAVEFGENLGRSDCRLWPSIRPAQASFPWVKTSNPSAIIICGATIARGEKQRRSPRSRTAKSSK